LDAKTEQIVNDFKKLGRVGYKDILEKIPEKERRYKCHTCFEVVDESPCPACGGTTLEIMCPLDHCHCGHDIVTTIAYCPICGDAMCPTCMSHDVSQVSRVTGYLADIAGFNNGKRAEMLDRHRYNIGAE
jgi:hypothetical protein